MIFFDEIDFEDDNTYPSRHLSQWKCLHKLIKDQPGRRKLSQFAELVNVDKSTFSKALKRKITKNQGVIHFHIAKRIAKKLKRPDLIGKLCPEYREMEIKSK